MAEEKREAVYIDGQLIQMARAISGIEGKEGQKISIAEVIERELRKPLSHCYKKAIRREHVSLGDGPVA